MSFLDIGLYIFDKRLISNENAEVSILIPSLGEKFYNSRLPAKNNEVSYSRITLNPNLACAYKWNPLQPSFPERGDLGL